MINRRYRNIMIIRVRNRQQHSMGTVIQRVINLNLNITTGRSSTTRSITIVIRQAKSVSTRLTTIIKTMTRLRFALEHYNETLTRRISRPTQHIFTMRRQKQTTRSFRTL